MDEVLHHKLFFRVCGFCSCPPPTKENVNKINGRGKKGEAAFSYASLDCYYRRLEDLTIGPIGFVLHKMGMKHTTSLSFVSWWTKDRFVFV